jgi:hypothetical protein
MKTFEEYLKEQHAEQYTGTDDDMPDDLDNWMSELSVSEVMIYADGWMAEYRSFIRLTIHDITK